MGTFERALLLYLCLAIACCFWQPQLIFGSNNNDNLLTSIFDINGTGVGDIGGISDAANNSLNTGSTNTGLFKKGTDVVGSTQFLVDGLSNVLGFIGSIFKAIFSPFIIFKSLVLNGAPVAVLWIFGIPLVFLFILGIIYFIRGAS